MNWFGVRFFHASNNELAAEISFSEERYSLSLVWNEDGTELLLVHDRTMTLYKFPDCQEVRTYTFDNEWTISRAFFWGEHLLVLGGGRVGSRILAGPGGAYLYCKDSGSLLDEMAEFSHGGTFLRDADSWVAWSGWYGRGSISRLTCEQAKLTAHPAIKIVLSDDTGQNPMPQIRAIRGNLVLLAWKSNGAGLYCTQRKKFVWLSDQVLRCSLLDDDHLYQLTTDHEVYKTRVVLS